MEGDEAALLRGINAARGDDAPRLVYADWLEENGRPERAAWIRAALAGGRETVAYWHGNIPDSGAHLMSDGTRFVLSRWLVASLSPAAIASEAAIATAVRNAPMKCCGLPIARAEAREIGGLWWAVDLEYSEKAHATPAAPAQV
jgi:uncharacterized protein (TIGR02996 family)